MLSFVTSMIEDVSVQMESHITADLLLASSIMGTQILSTREGLFY